MTRRIRIKRTWLFDQKIRGSRLVAGPANSLAEAIGHTLELNSILGLCRPCPQDYPAVWPTTVLNTLVLQFSLLFLLKLTMEEKHFSRGKCGWLEVGRLVVRHLISIIGC